MMRRLSLMLSVSMACTDPVSSLATDTSAIGNDDSGDTSGASDTGACAVHLTSTDPAEGTTELYVRDPLTLSFDGDGGSALIEVRDPAGTPATMTEDWQAGNNQVILRGALEPSTSYTLHVELCGVTQEVHFSTSSIGLLDVAVADLIGKTYSFALADAEITEPAILEMFDDSKLVTPLGFMVENADADSMDLLGATLTLQGGDLVQVSDADTWDFPTADFSAAPYFDTRVDSLSFVYVGSSSKTTITLYNFQFDGTFAADGSAIVQGHIDTDVDTRTLGPLFNLSDTPDAVCVFAADFAVTCVPCPDGEPYCLHTVGQDITAPVAEGLVLTPYP